MSGHSRIVTLAAGLALALAVVLGGPACKKKADVTPNTPAAIVQAAPQQHAPVEQSLGALPPGISFVAGVQSLDALRTASQGFQDALGAGDGAAALRAAFDLPAAAEAAIDPARPLFAVADWNTEGGVAAAIPIKDGAAFQAAFGDGAGGAIELVGAPPDAWAIVAGSPTAAAALRPTLDKARASLKPQAPVQLVVSGQALRDKVQPALKAMREELVRDLEFGAAMSPLPMSAASLGTFYGSWFDRANRVLDEIEVVDLRLAADAERLRLELLLGVKDGGKLRKLVARGEAGGSAAAGLLPADAWAVLVANIDPSLFTGMKDDAVKVLGDVVKASGTPSYDLAALYDAAYEVQTGDSALALYASEGFPFATAAVILTKDGDRYRETLKKFSDLYLNVMQGTLSGMPGAPPMDFSSWGKLFSGINSVASAFGLSVEADSDGDVSGVRVGLNWNRIPSFGDPSGLERQKKLWGSKWELAFGFGPVVSAICFGPTAFADAERILGGSAPYADEGFRASVARGAAHPFVIAWLDAGRASQAWANLVESLLMERDGPQAKEIGQKLRTAKPGQGIAFTVGGSGTTLQAVLDLPVAPIKELAALFR
jgi:hypothetical protein